MWGGAEKTGQRVVDIVQKSGVFLSYVQFHLLLAILFVDLSNLIVLV